MGETALAAVLEAPGRLTMREFPLPEIGPDEALLRVEMAGVCATDPAWASGKVALPAFPMILGHEILGRIARIGREAAARYGVKEGDRVVVEGSTRCDHCDYCISGDYHLCDNRRSYGSTVPTTVPPALWGGYSQYLYLAPGSMLHRVSEGMPAEGGVLACAVVANGIKWVRECGQAGLGQSVVIQGVGPQGLACIVAAKESGAGPVIATGLSRDRARFALARELGADVIIDVERDDLQGRVREATNGRMADLVVDVTGSPPAVKASLDLVRKRGRMIQAGVTGTTTLTPLPLDTLLFREITLQGVFAHTVTSVRAAIRVIESRRYPLEKLVTHHYPLREAAHALRVTAREVPGEDPIKVVLTP